jgi:hypothetical protein
MSAVGRTGKQRGRAKRGAWYGLGVIVLMALALVALCVWLLVARPPKLDVGGRNTVVAIFGPLAVLLLGLAWYVFRKAKPARARHLRIDLAMSETRRGGPVEVTLNVDRAPARGCELELALVCTEHYDIKQRVHNPNGADYDQRVTKTAEIHRDGSDVEPVEGPKRVSFTVPPAGPFSYQGNAISATWSVRASERRPRRSDRHVETPVWVAP